jgi:uncharacterized protein
MELSEKDKVILIDAARNSINSVFSVGYPPLINYDQHIFLKSNCGAFVTLRNNKELRGCIGYILGKTPLFETVCDAAKQAAFNDPRFPPLTQDEMDNLKIEISVLSIPQNIKNYEEIILGKHGLLLEEGLNKAVLLPQVAKENNYNVEEFLSALCEKAGLYSHLWKSKMLNLKTFEAQVFSEENLKPENDE